MTLTYRNTLNFKINKTENINKFYQENYNLLVRN